MKKLLLLLFSLIMGFNANANTPPPDEGMWLPLLIERLNYVDMKKMGLQLTPEELYSVNHSSLKDAIVGLASGSAPYGYFCTAEVVSDQGLLLTNHHCGFAAVQEQSSSENDYLTNGFWAMSMNEELPNNGMTASFLIRMEDVTKKVLENVYDAMTETERQDAIDKVIDELMEENSEKDKYEVIVKDFYEGNEYYMFVYLTFRDVRLVGAPPSSIGKFGGDTDNWEWPRHTGDFAILRIYSAPDGSPADYSEENVPLRPKHYLPISLERKKKGDFVMIWGYPGGTERFLTSYGVELAIKESNPSVVKIRDKKLAILREDMDASKDVKLKYASKYAESSNYWKYFIGQTRGLKRLKILEKKQEIEKNFMEWVNTNDERKKKYASALGQIENGYNELKKVNIVIKYVEEAVLQGPEIIYFSFGAYRLYNLLLMQDTTKKREKTKYNSPIKSNAEAFREELDGFFKDYNLPTDKKLFAALLKMYYDDIPKEYQPAVFATVDKKFKGDFSRYADYVYSNSIFTDQAKLEAFLNNPSYKVISRDPGFRITLDFINIARSVYPKLDEIQEKINIGNRYFIAGLMEMNPDKVFYPDANSTMRMTYGQVLDYFPADAVHYDFVTYLKGVIEKEDPGNDEFIVPEKLKELYKSKDFGRYGENGRMIVCFLTNTDISGGNSGSPVLDAKGHLIGIAFDGNWEAMSGDIAFEAALQRTINVDIRYVLFIIDKYAGAKYLVDEMTILEKTPETKAEAESIEVTE